MAHDVSILTLHTRDTFAIAHGRFESYHNVLLVLRDGARVGYGECAPRPYHGDNLDSCVLALRQWCDSNPTDATELDVTLDAFEGPAPARAALDLALHDLAAQRAGVSLSELCRQRYRLTPGEMPLSSFTIGIDTLERVEEKVRAAAGWPILKVKLGTDNDLALVERVRAMTDVELRVDANCAWTIAETRRMAKRLATLGVTRLEQPLARDALESYRALHGTLPLPVIADESCRTLDDVDRLVGAVDGINVKLSKVGGIRAAARMITAGRQSGMRIMLGCFLESSLAITAAAALATFVDDLDLDGAALLADDPFDGATVQQGHVRLPDRIGLGARPRSASAIPR